METLTDLNLILSVLVKCLLLFFLVFMVMITISAYVAFRKLINKTNESIDAVKTKVADLQNFDLSESLNFNKAGKKFRAGFQMVILNGILKFIRSIFSK